MILCTDAKTYHRIKKWVFYAGLLVDVLFLLALAWSGISLQLQAWAGHFSANPWIVNAVYLFLFSLAFYFLHFPLSFFEGYVWEHQFRLSNQNFRSWFTEDLKKSLLSFLLLFILIEAIYTLLRHFPGDWWWLAGGVWLFWSLVIARITPNIIVPLFYKYTALENNALREQIKELFSQCRVALQDVYAINFSKDSKKANAFICGVGRSRRVVLTDTLLANFSPEEIRTVVAHELGHYKHRDILKLIAVNAAVTFLGFFLADKFLRSFLDLGSGASGVRIEDIGSLPFLALTMMIFGLATSPALNAFSRLLEVEADRFSIQLTKAPAQFISMMKKLGEMNLAEEDPGWFDVVMFYDHPPVKQRIQFAQGFLPTSGSWNPTG